jgi:hypothetical protein
MGADDPTQPQFQLGDGCLVDQLMGQYLADMAGLGPLLKPENIRKAVQSVYRYNHKPNLYEHDSVQRTFALNDEAAIVICDYGKGKRPTIPFPYYAEVMTGFEYTAASLMLYQGMVDHGVACIADIRRRFDGVRRNPWDEAECGHHYARAMASWSGVLALTGFRYRGDERHVVVAPPAAGPEFRSFWAAGAAWGQLRLAARGRKSLSLEVIEGALAVKRIELAANKAGSATVSLDGKRLQSEAKHGSGRMVVTLAEAITLGPKQSFTVEI